MIAIRTAGLVPTLGASGRLFFILTVEAGVKGGPFRRPSKAEQEVHQQPLFPFRAPRDGVSITEARAGDGAVMGP
ncbi:unnamed protein product [Boreogadus saida]